MTTLREAAQQALKALKNIDKEFSKHGRQHWPEAVKARAAIAPLRAALAGGDNLSPTEPVQEPFFTEANGFPQTFVPKDRQKQAIISLTDQCAALIQERDELQKQVWLYEKNGVTCQTYRHTVEQSCAECNVQMSYTSPPQPAEPVQEHDLSRCPKCGGPADNGHDREVPPNPYYCTKCMAEPVAWRWGYRSVTTGEMDWRGYVEIPAHPNLRSPEIIMEPLYAAPPQRKPLTDKEIDALRQGAERLNFVTLREFRIIARAIERAHGIGDSDE